MHKHQRRVCPLCLEVTQAKSVSIRMHSLPVRFENHDRAEDAAQCSGSRLSDGSLLQVNLPGGINLQYNKSNGALSLWEHHENSLWCHVALAWRQKLDWLMSSTPYCWMSNKRHFKSSVSDSFRQVCHWPPALKLLDLLTKINISV